MIKDWSKASIYFGVGAIGSGVIAIFIAWNGAASIDYTQGQIPYVISGGLGGLALVFVGTMVLVVQNSRRDRAAMVRELQRLIAVMEKGVPASQSGNGKAGLEGLYVAGSDTFHLPGCKLVVGRSHDALVTMEDAIERGLEACRVCHPGARISGGSKPARARRGNRKKA